jgi:hypothetical protein
MITLKDEFSHIEVGKPQHFRNLTLFPLFRRDVAATEPEYLLLEEAIGQGLARVTEMGGGGSVPELRFENNAERPTLLLDGEELIGAKQNRVLNLTILVPAKQTIVIPVSCVEAGRWHQNSPIFKSADHVMYSRARAARVAHVTNSMRTTGTRRSDQSAVWEELSAKASRMEAESPTQAMAAIYERHTISVEEYVRNFAWLESQAGVAFAFSGRLAGLDLLDHPLTMRKLFPKLVRSYALDALDAPAEKTEPATRPDVSNWLEQLMTAQSFSQPGVGLGKDVRLNGHSVSGAALWALERYIHVCAFAVNGHSSPPDFQTRFSRPTRRRFS